MARKIGSMTMKNSLEPTVGAPLDGRLQVKVKEDLYADGSYPKYYNGMIVSLKNNGDAYKLSGVPTNETDWKRILTEDDLAGLLTEDDLAGYQPTITVDDALSDTSENPVQNKVIKAAIDAAGSAGEYEYNFSWDADSHDLIINEGTDDEQKLRLTGLASQSSIPSAYDDTDLVNRVTALEESVGSGGGSSSYDDTLLKARIEALEAKLADYAEVTLKMSDGTNEVDKLILAKDKATPPTPVYTNMFDLPIGAYDAEGSLITADLDYIAEEEGEYDGPDTLPHYFYGLYINSLPAGTRGVVLPHAPEGFDNKWNLRELTSDTDLDWIVVQDDIYWIGIDFCDKSIGVIYYRGIDPNAPWGQTGAEVNTTGIPLYWERRTMFDLEEGLYDAQGNKLGEYSSAYAEYEAEYDIGEGNLVTALYSIRADEIARDFPTARGLVLSEEAITGEPLLTNATEGQFDWIVLNATAESYGERAINQNMSLADVPTVNTIYVVPDTAYVRTVVPDNKWGQTSATIDTVGNIPWEV